ncbi:hypothetical protein [Paenibacillus sp. V4I7]|uniref:hypothetical protein n=1 Tax=Paenibacillus sp. V4I7 TaxID=3042307 RepID=UPI00278349F6|nr:hypothetical protein [Paenibacillus sp. V4I7]MDQ0901144.1 hypothetical protein [Paenibacillus sp. V4I7]
MLMVRKAAVFNTIFPNNLLLYSELNKEYGKATGFDVYASGDLDRLEGFYADQNYWVLEV